MKKIYISNEIGERVVPRNYPQQESSFVGLESLFHSTVDKQLKEKIRKTIDMKRTLFFELYQRGLVSV